MTAEDADHIAWKPCFQNHDQDFQKGFCTSGMWWNQSKLGREIQEFMVILQRLFFRYYESQAWAVQIIEKMTFNFW